MNKAPKAAWGLAFVALLLLIAASFIDRAHAAGPLDDLPIPPILKGRGTGLCPRIELRSKEALSFTPSERRLVCGDPKTPAWSNIPLPQAAYFMRNFLQDRGYHAAQTTIEGDRLIVIAGEKTLVREVVLDNAPTPIDPRRYWRIFGRPLTPAALDEIGKWLKRQLSQNAFPCASFTLSADPATGIIRAEFDPAFEISMPRIIADNIPDTNGELPSRYAAYNTDAPYDSLKLELSARRLVHDEVVLNAHFSTECSNDGKSVIVRERVLPGQPRILSAGIGFDTEEFVIAEAGWKNTRFGDQASRLVANARASYRRQEARFSFDWYYAPIVARHFLRQSAKLTRESERRYETRSYKLQAGPAWTTDRGNSYIELWTDVGFEQNATVRGLGPKLTRFLTAELALATHTHDFEFYAQSPRSGYSASVDFTRAKRGVASDISATRVATSATALWNLFDLDPPIWVIGVRTNLATTMLGKDSESADLPPSLRNALGGSSNLRGFGRKALPPDDRGALTTAYVGAEARIREVLPFGLQPIVFVDAGKLGTRGASLDPGLYWSPGTGLNWQSPIGTLRFTAAHGFIDGPKHDEWQAQSRWQIYVSFGEQF